MKHFLLLALMCPLYLFAQPSDTTFRSSLSSEGKYTVNPWVTVPYIALGGYAGQQRLLKLQRKEELTLGDIEALDPNDVPGIDRIALRQDFDKHKDALIWSDYIFNTGQFIPFSLFFWKKYRQDWLPITLMYFEAQVTQGLFYGYAPFGPTGNDRYRPRVYYDEAPFDSRIEGNEKNSTFSGHVSVAATGFYFAAKMIDDYNPQFTGGQRVLLYVGASVPGITMGYLRMKGLKHFPTDSAIGLGVGAISGILVPELHAWWARRHKTEVLVTPLYGGGAAGAGLTLKF